MMEHDDWHAQTRTNLLDALAAVGIDAIPDPFMPTGEVIYNLAGALAAQLAADVHGSVTADITRSGALAAFAAGWAGVYRAAEHTAAEQSSHLAILVDCAATAAARIAKDNPSPYAGPATLALTGAAAIASLAGDDLPAMLAAAQRDETAATLASLMAAWRGACEVDRP